MLTYTNPRTQLTVNDWPHGRKRVKAIFSIEATPRGERAVRITENPKGGFNKPKKLTYCKQCRIVDGSDGKTYLVELSDYEFISIMQSNMQTGEETIYKSDIRYADIANLFLEPK